MAEASTLPVAKSILGKIASFTGDLIIGDVAEEISAAKSAKKDLIIIFQKMEAICAVLEDAEKKQFTNKAMDLWLTDPKSVVYDIDDLLASLLRNVRDDQEWQRINDMDSFIGINNQEYKVMQVLKLNYDKLTSHLKSCFVYLSLYAKDTLLTTAGVPYMWSALGLLKLENTVNDIEDGGYFDLMELVWKSLL